MKRKQCNEYFVDGLPLLAPDVGVNISENDLDAQESGRDESGYMHRIVVRHAIKTWEFIYSVLDTEDYDYIQLLFKGKSDFQFEYRDSDGSMKTTRAYVSKRSITLRNYATGEYKNLKFNIIEC
ncbi:MAG: hypothetical protein IJX37_01850 [Oscillospiraceae bacterium]|nr:hypothetical protein [Oscillospiraceae bacterium]